jgi:hypothetical protein
VSLPAAVLLLASHNCQKPLPASASQKAAQLLQLPFNKLALILLPRLRCSSKQRLESVPAESIGQGHMTALRLDLRLSFPASTSTTAGHQ